MHILEQVLALGGAFLNWYVVYFVVAAGAFGAYLVYRLWLPDWLRARQARARGPQHRRSD